VPRNLEARPGLPCGMVQGTPKTQEKPKDAQRKATDKPEDKGNMGSNKAGSGQGKAKN
jgi:hypothetical protein